MDTSDPKAVTVWLTRAIAYVAYAFLVVSEIILLQGFLLKLFGANPGSSFVEWSYRNLDSAMKPFRGIFAPIELGVNGNDVQATLETSIIFAMVIYGILAITVSAIISWLTHRIHRLDQQSIREHARIQHERELQALRDQAAILDARRDARLPGQYPLGSAPPAGAAPTAHGAAPTTESAPLQPGHGQAPPSNS